jgi:hypothetical protein
MHTPDSLDADSPPADPEPLRVVLELARAAQVDDPYAFQFTPQNYIVHTPGGGFAAAEMPWDAALLADLQALREPRWEPALIQRFGERLRRFLGGTGWALEEQRIVEAVRRGQPTILTIRSAAAELYALPWELVTIKATGQHLGELQGCVVRYEWPGTATAREQAVERGRVLFAWSAAAGAVPAGEHLAAILSACTSSRYPFDPAADVLAHASCERLVATLRAAAEQHRPFTVLHLLGHGAAHGQTFGLALTSGDDAGLVVVDAGRLRQLLAPFAATLRLVVLAACDGGNAGALGNHLGSVAQTLHRAGLQVVLASRFPLSTAGSVRLARTLYDRLLVHREPAEQAVAAARADLARDPTRLDWAALQYYARLADGDATHPLFVRPFRGLAPFRAEHAWAFFGRAAETAELRARVLEAQARGTPRFIVVAGAAGVGKTSLIQAGLVPALAASGWRTLEVTPGAAPFADLADALAGLTATTGAPDADGARAALATWQRREPGRPVLLVVDPLEELFAAAELAQRVRFVRLLWSLACDPGLRVSVVVALRIDVIGRCGELVLDERSDLRLDQVAYDAKHRVFVAQLGIPQLRAAIAMPARAVGVDLDPGLTERIVAEVAGQPGALSMLQHALKLLWKQRRERRLTLAAYDAIGGVGGALERHAEGILGRLTPDQLRQARRTLVRLASARGEAGMETRRRVPLDQIQPTRPGEAEAFREALARLISARLVVLGEQTGPRGAGKQATAELVHDALLHRWQRLRAWVREDWARVALLLKVELWVHEWQEHGSLLDEQRLGYALEVAGKYGDDLPAEALALIERSREDLAAAHAAEAARRAELEGMLGATQDLLHAADEDMQRAEAELVRLRRLLRLAAALAALCVAWALLAATLAASPALARVHTTVDELIRGLALSAGRAGGQP